MSIVIPMMPLAIDAHLGRSQSNMHTPDAAIAYIIALGSWSEASFSSSDMWAPASGPMKHHSGVVNPTRHDTPVVDHPPPLLVDEVSVASPPLVVKRDSLECSEDIIGRGVIGHDPKDQKKGKEGKDVSEQDDALGERQVLSEEDVEADGDEQKGKDDEGRLPQVLHVRILVDQKNHLLDHACELQATGWDPRNPAQTAEPADDVREWSLERSRCELGYPVVLSASASCQRLGKVSRESGRAGSRCWCHACHLRSAIDRQHRSFQIEHKNRVLVPAAESLTAMQSSPACTASNPLYSK